MLHLSTLTLNDTRLSSYSVSSCPLEIGPELTLDYPLVFVAVPHE